MANYFQRNRGRRGATCSANMCRIKLQKVLTMIRVVNAFRTITNRLTVFSPKLWDLGIVPVCTSSSTKRKQTIASNSYSPQKQSHLTFKLAGVSAMSETASIAATATVTATASNSSLQPAASATSLPCM